MKLKILGQPYDEMLKVTDSRYKNYKANEDRKNPKDGLLYRKYFGKTDAKTIAKILINIMTKHAYLPTTLISDKGTAFMSHVIKEVAGVLGITLKHATTKHGQTIGLLERSHMSIKQALKMETGERRSFWHKYVSIASFIITLLITKVLVVSQAESFTAVFNTTSWT